MLRSRAAPLFRVVDAHQIKPIRWRNGPTARAIGGGERGGDIVGAHLAETNLHQRADHRAYLTMQEALRFAANLDGIAVAGDAAKVERFHRALGLAAGVAKGGEIVVANEPLGGDIHGLLVKLTRKAPDEPARESCRRAAVEDGVKIGALGGVEAGVELGRRFFGAEN